MEKILTKSEMTNFIDNNTSELVVVKFSAPWCNPCKVLAETIEDIVPNFPNVAFGEIDVDECEEELAADYNIRNVPVLLFFKDGLQLDRTVGLLGREQLVNKINENLNK